MAPGGPAALVFRKRGVGPLTQIDAGGMRGGVEASAGHWDLGSCAKVPLGPALQRAAGEPVAVGRADRRLRRGKLRRRAVRRPRRAGGRTLAWDARPGAAHHVAVCAGARTVVAVGGPESGGAQLSVHDGTDLRVRRTVALQGRALALRTPVPVVAARCLDDAGERVDVLLRNRDGANGRILHADGARVTRENLGTGGGDGARGRRLYRGPREATDPADAPRLADGRREVARLDEVSEDGGMAVSPDERTVALLARGSLTTLDLRTGKQLGTWTVKPLRPTGLVWAGPDRLLLLLRREMIHRQTPVPLYAFNRRATPVGQWRPVIGEWVGAVGDAAVIHGYGSRLTVVRGPDVPLVAESLRLATAEHLAGVPGRNFAARTGA